MILNKMDLALQVKQHKVQILIRIQMLNLSSNQPILSQPILSQPILSQPILSQPILSRQPRISRQPILSLLNQLMLSQLMLNQLIQIRIKQNQHLLLLIPKIILSLKISLIRTLTI
jgi:hypothetical protein